MIRILGAEGTSEYEAATSILQALSALWPGIAESPEDEDHIIIFSNARISSNRAREFDVIIAARLRPGRRFVPKKELLDREGKQVIGKRIDVPNFIVVVEVKEHDAKGVDIVGDIVKVKYLEGGREDWKDATDQNDKQVYSLKTYFKLRRGVDIFVHRCLLMQGLPEITVSGCIPATFSGTDFLTAMARVSGVTRRGQDFVFSSTSNEIMNGVLSDPIFKQVTPSGLDRARMDRIAARVPQAEEIVKLLGVRRVHIRGHGGTGKTVLLLQTAMTSFQQSGKRLLILTYNLALAADITRLMALMRIPAGLEQGGIEVGTVMSFMCTWMASLGVMNNDEEMSSDYYVEKCLETLELLRSGGLSSQDINFAKASASARFKFDAILVDEAQDWPQPEADLLCALYGAEKILIADGATQLVRGLPTDWHVPSGAGHVVELVHLRQCLRMKANLSRFAIKLAQKVRMNWSVEVNDKAAGGRVIIQKGSYTSKTDLQRELLDLAVDSGNDKIDFLHCVPANSVSFVSNRRESELGKSFSQQGEQVWDGVDELIRRDFARTKETYRVVQYESSRGLEGWVTVLDGFDDFWHAKFHERCSQGLSESEKKSFRELDDLAQEAAWRWAMIAITRPIDTLVITLRDPASVPSQALLAVARAMPDIVEVNLE